MCCHCVLNLIVNCYVLGSHGDMRFDTSNSLIGENQGINYPCWGATLSVQKHKCGRRN